MTQIGSHSRAVMVAARQVIKRVERSQVQPAKAA